MNSLGKIKDGFSKDLQQPMEEWWSWLNQLPSEKQMAYLLQLFDFDNLIGNPLSRSGQTDLPEETEEQQGLVFYALALWRLHERRDRIRKARESQAAAIETAV